MTTCADPMIELSDKIRDDYRDGPADRCAVRHGIRRLMTECGELFENEEAAFSFLTE